MTEEDEEIDPKLRVLSVSLHKLGGMRAARTGNETQSAIVLVM